MKCVWIKVKRLGKKILNKFIIVLSYIFLLLSVVTSLVLLIPNCFGRVPILLYYISEARLPLVYELSGKVIILDENDEVINENIEVFIGGYKGVYLTSTEFNLKFSSPMTNEIFVVIRYKIDGVTKSFIDSVTYDYGSYSTKEEFVIHV